MTSAQPIESIHSESGGRDTDSPKILLLLWKSVNSPDICRTYLINADSSAAGDAVNREWEDPHRAEGPMSGSPPQAPLPSGIYAMLSRNNALTLGIRVPLRFVSP